MLPLIALLIVSATGDVERHWSTRFVTTNWSVAEGLPQTSVTDVAQDARGFLWITTLGGLARFDGREFKRVAEERADFGSLRFTSVACTGSTIWVGTEHGRLFRVDDWGNAAPREVPLEPSNEPLWELVPTPAGTLLVAAGRAGAYAVDDSAKRLSARHVSHVAHSADGTDWLLGAAGLECSGPRCLHPDYAITAARSLWLSGEGRPHVLTEDGTVFEVDAGQLKQVSTAQPEALGIVDLERSRFWTAHQDEIRLETAAGTEDVLLFHPLRRSQPGVDWKVHTRKLFIDAQGTLWIGTNNAGLFRIRDRRVRQVGLSEGMIGESASLVLPLPSGGALVGAYCHGLQRYADGVISPIALPTEDGCVFGMQSTEGGAWIGLSGKLIRFDEQRGLQTVFDEPDPPGRHFSEFKAILADPTTPGALWLGTTAGLWRLESAQGALQRRQAWRVADGLPHDTVSTLALDNDGSLLVGTLRGAVRLRQGDGGAWKVERLFEPDDDRLASIRDFWVEPRGVIWVATYGEGLARLDGRTTGPRPAQWLERSRGFCSDELSRIVPIVHPPKASIGDEVWINSNRGVFRIAQAELESFALGQGRLGCRVLATGEGNGGGQTAGGTLSTGQLIFPTVAGLAVIDPAELREPRPLLPLFIDAASMSDVALALEGERLVPPGSHDLSVHLSAPPDEWSDTVEAELTLYRDGELKHRELGGLEAHYLDLSPGHYVFEARRLNGDGELGRPASLRFELAPMITERPLVRLAFALAIVLAGLGWVRVLRSRAHALEAELREHERAEAARLERDAVYQTVFDGSPGPLFLLGREGALAKLNPAAQRLLATTSLPGTLVSFLKPSEQAGFRELISRSVTAAHSAEHTLITQSGEERLVRLIAGPLTLGGVPHTLVAATDVTAEREAARQRDALLTRTANAQRLEGLGRLAAGVAHDFNNVLAVLQLELEELKLLGPTEPLVSEMQDAINSGKSLTSRFLVFGRDEAEAPTVTLDDAVAHARRLLARLVKTDVELIIDSQAPGVAVRLASSHLDQLLLNLVVNAQDAVSAGGKVTLRTRKGATVRDEVVVLPKPAGAIVELSVEDTGHGMDATTLSRAFEPFFTTKGPAYGTGMGLAVVHGIASRAGAGLSVRSRVDGGTTFSLQFGVVSVPTAEEKAAALKSDSAVAGTRTVLVCEDAPPLRKALARLFRAEGLQVLEAPDGAAGLALLAQRNVHLVVTDLMMPLLDGRGLISALRKQGRQMPIILLSGFPANTLGELDEAARVAVVAMQKPVEPSVLLDVARRLLMEASLDSVVAAAAPQPIPRGEPQQRRAEDHSDGE